MLVAQQPVTEHLNTLALRPSAKDVLQHGAGFYVPEAGISGSSTAGSQQTNEL